MSVRVSPLWWPLLAISTPVTVPALLVRNRRFREDRVRAAAPQRVLLSGHDTGDHALARMQGELHADTAVLKAGAA